MTKLKQNIKEITNFFFKEIFLKFVISFFSTKKLTYFFSLGRDLSSIESNKRRYDSTDWFGSQLPIVYQMRNAKTSENIFFRNPAYK